MDRAVKFVAFIPRTTIHFRAAKHNDSTVRDLLKRGVNVATVLEGITRRFGGFRVINGDENDARFRDPIGVVVGLKYKPTKADNPAAMDFAAKPKPSIKMKKKDKNDIDNSPISVRNNSNSNSSNERYEKWKIT